MVPRWVVVDKLVHELGSLRAVVQEVEAQADSAENEVVVELRSSLARAADTIHLVIGGNEGMVEKAWRCIADAQEVGDRARLAVQRGRASRHDARSIGEGARVQTPRAARQGDELQGMRKAESRRPPKREPRAKV